MNFEAVSAIFAPQLSRKDGGNWSCDVLATHSPVADKGATSYLGIGADFYRHLPIVIYNIPKRNFMNAIATRKDNGEV